MSRFIRASTGLALLPAQAAAGAWPAVLLLLAFLDRDRLGGQCGPGEHRLARSGLFAAGTAHFKAAMGIVGARFAWYTSVVVIVLGHVLALHVAHRLALTRFTDSRTARRSQYPLAALMVAYTMVSLWILAQPIVETRP